MTIGERIKEIRKKNGFTQGTLAEELQVAKGTVSAWEIGSRRPSFEMLDTMCTLFHVRMDYLIAQSDDATPLQEPTEADLNSMAEAGLTMEQEQDADWLNGTLHQFCSDFARMDAFARKALLSLYKEEKNRCVQQGGMAGEDSYVCAVNIKAVK